MAVGMNGDQSLGWPNLFGSCAYDLNQSSNKIWMLTVAIMHETAVWQFGCLCWCLRCTTWNGQLWVALLELGCTFVVTISWTFGCWPIIFSNPKFVGVVSVAFGWPARGLHPGLLADHFTIGVWVTHACQWIWLWFMQPRFLETKTAEVLVHLMTFDHQVSNLIWPWIAALDWWTPMQTACYITQACKSKGI